MPNDTERLEFILSKAASDFRFNIQDILGDYDGDDYKEYLQSARNAIDEAMTEETEKKSESGERGLSLEWIRENALKTLKDAEDKILDRRRKSK